MGWFTTAPSMDTFYAFDETAGGLVWDWSAGPSGYDTVYGSWPVKVVELVADGKVYLNGGHTYNPPLYRGAQAYCLNATTGELIWQVDSFCESNSPVVAAADGVLLLPNAYDDPLYARYKTKRHNHRCPLNCCNIWIKRYNTWYSH